MVFSRYVLRRGNVFGICRCRGRRVVLEMFGFAEEREEGGVGPCWIVEEG
jgi:hypothetical protein